MTILTGPEITRQVGLGAITIEPFAPEQVNPVSYNYRLGPTLKTNQSPVIDSRHVQDLEEITIPEAGYRLMPGILYLGTTVERIGSPHFVTSLSGRSSTGRLGIWVETAAQLGNLHHTAHSWTLELKVVQPVIVYAGMKIGQVYFTTATGETADYTGVFGNLDHATTAPAGHFTTAR